MGSDSPLSGQHALVTGSSSGIGEAVAGRLAAAGCAVAVHGRAPDRVEQVVARISADGGHAVAVFGDLTDPATPVEVVDRARDQLGGLDILVNSAGAGATAAALDLEVDRWQQVMALNLTAPFLCAQAAARTMSIQGSGVIVNIGSTFGHVAVPGRAAYSAAKAGLGALTKVLGLEWGAHGIRVVSVDPGMVRTSMAERNMAAGAFTFADLEWRTAAGRAAEPEEIAEVVCFLVGSGASYITASTLLVDGGYAAHGGWPAHKAEP